MSGFIKYRRSKCGNVGLSLKGSPRETDSFLELSQKGWHRLLQSRHYFSKGGFLPSFAS